MSWKKYLYVGDGAPMAPGQLWLPLDRYEEFVVFLAGTLLVLIAGARVGFRQTLITALRRCLQRFPASALLAPVTEKANAVKRASMMMRFIEKS